MIHTVRIRGFKRFNEVQFRLPGHVVLAGPNNTGKTTVLQAIASWSFALQRWRQFSDFDRRQEYTRVPIMRSAFTTVPLQTFDLLWTDRQRRQPMEIEIQHDQGWSVTMELHHDSIDQIYVRPKANVPAEILRECNLQSIFVPPMTGIGVEEPVYQSPKIEQLLGLGRPGEVLRNLLANAYDDNVAWGHLQASIRKLFNYELLPPDSSGPNILMEYRTEKGNSLDIACAGSGFLQVLMLLVFLNTRRDAILLLDEPDAHLHIILQDAIYHELRTAANRQRSQLIIATHSEVIIDSVEPRELCIVLDKPRMVEGREQRSQLITALRVLSNTDLMQAQITRGILYVEGHTDISILRAWAAALKHRAVDLLTTELMWKPYNFQAQAYRPGIRAQDHYDSLLLTRKEFPGLELLDGDARPEIGDTPITGSGLQRLRWRRYEIESYLVHPDALARFVESLVDVAAASRVEDMLAYMRKEFPPNVIDEPLGEHPFLMATKARTQILPPVLSAAGIHGLPYTRYHEIAEIMQPKEIHPEVTEKLDAICHAFGINP